MAVIVLYTICLALSVGLLTALISLFSKHVSVHFLMLYVSVAIICLGNLQIACAPNVDAALAGNQVSYSASCFIMYFCLKCVAELCRFSLPRWLDALCVMLGAALFSIIFTNAQTGLFYTDVSISVEDGFTRLVKSYGPLHSAHMALLIAYACGCIAIIARAIHLRKTISIVNTLGLLAAILTVLLTYMLQKVFSTPFDLLPIGYVLALTVLTCLIARIRRTDVDGFASLAMKSDGRFDFLLFSKSGRYEGCGKLAGQWFPEVTELWLDTRLKDPSTPFLRQVKSWIDGKAADDSKLFTCGSRIISVRHLPVSEALGDMHCIMLMDDTMHQQYLALMKGYNEELEAAVNEKTAKLKALQLDIIVGMASIVENRDSNTGGHIQRTSDVINVFVRHMLQQNSSVLSADLAEDIISAAPLHDFGKIAIPDAVLNKPGKFTPEEYDIMKQHSAKGAVIVSNILRNSDDSAFRSAAVNIAHYHHERWDGKGYPEKLAGNAIPLEARIMALADVFDALVSKRVYKEAFSFEQAFSIIAEGSGTQFDPALTPLFLECRPQLESLYLSYAD